MTFDSLIFDLDGTLWDTTHSCALGWNKVLQRHNISFRTISAEDIRRVTGKPHDTCIRETFVGLSEKELQILSHETESEDIRAVQQWGGHLYEGVVEGIRNLSRHYALFIVSNCQAGYIELFLKHSELQNSFKDIECWGNTGRPKPENIQKILQRNSLKNPLYVGDTEGDRAAAHENFIPFFYVDYGFGNVEKYEERFSSFCELEKRLLSD